MTKRRTTRLRELHLHPGKKVTMGSSGAVVGAIVGGPVAALIGGALGVALGAAAQAKPQKPAKVRPPAAHAPAEKKSPARALKRRANSRRPRARKVPA